MKTYRNIDDAHAFFLFASQYISFRAPQEGNVQTTTDISCEKFRQIKRT